MEISSIIIILIALIITILELTNSSADTFYEGFINRFTIFYKISAEYLIRFIAVVLSIGVEILRAICTVY